MGDWLADQRTAVAADRILDAADELFSRQDAATVGMNDVARAAGCSRATVYRYFENRDALHDAYAHRETHRVFYRTGQLLAGITDPHQKLIDGVLVTLASVRESPALSSWFASTQRPIGAELAGRSEVIRGLTEAFLASLGVERVEPTARWLLRVMISLLLFPGLDDADERAMLTEFVLPVLTRRQGPADRVASRRGIVTTSTTSRTLGG